MLTSTEHSGNHHQLRGSEFSTRHLRTSEATDYATADRFTAFAQEAGVKPAILAVAWAMSHPGVTAPIIGARDLTQLGDSLAALETDLSGDLREQISALSPAPAPATDRAEILKPTWT